MGHSVTDRPERLGLADRVARSRRIVEARDVEGLPWAVIAEREVCSVRTATRAYEEARRVAAPVSVAEIDVEALAVRVVGAHLTAMDRLEALAGQRQNQNAALGASARLATVGASLLAVLARIGLLPDPGSQWLLAAETRAVARQISDACERHGVPPEAMRAIVGAAETEADRLDPGPVVSGTAEAA